MEAGQKQRLGGGMNLIAGFGAGRPGRRRAWPREEPGRPQAGRQTKVLHWGIHSIRQRLPNLIIQVVSYLVLYLILFSGYYAYLILYSICKICLSKFLLLPFFLIFFVDFFSYLFRIFINFFVSYFNFLEFYFKFLLKSENATVKCTKNRRTNKRSELLTLLVPLESIRSGLLAQARESILSLFQVKLLVLLALVAALPVVEVASASSVAAAASAAATAATPAASVVVGLEADQVVGDGGFDVVPGYLVPFGVGVLHAEDLLLAELLARNLLSIISLPSSLLLRSISTNTAHILFQSQFLDLRLLVLFLLSLRVGVLLVLVLGLGGGLLDGLVLAGQLVLDGAHVAGP